MENIQVLFIFKILKIGEAVKNMSRPSTTRSDLVALINTLRAGDKTKISALQAEVDRLRSALSDAQTALASASASGSSSVASDEESKEYDYITKLLERNFKPSAAVWCKSGSHEVCDAEAIKSLIGKRPRRVEAVFSDPDNVDESYGTMNDGFLAKSTDAEWYE